jgi:polyvinyl alcohol dehydrogenase (cytochrome)
LKWAFGYPGGSTSAYAQPSVVDGRIFVGTDIGYVYSLDAVTGCVYWSYRTKAGVRAAISVGTVTGHAPAKVAAFVGDLKSNVYALDARTGTLLWEAKVDDNFTARVTAAPSLHDGTLYVPVSSWEEFNARSLDYPCCTSVGSVVALDANAGRQLWKTYVIDERPKPVRKNSKGVQLFAPAGGSIWNSPTIDSRRGVLYVGTGDGTTYPPAATTDSVLALDLRSGRRVWSYQVHDMDSFLVGCHAQAGRTENCPPVQGPDWDIPNSPILQWLPDGKRVLIVGTKPGDVLALDPDSNGKLLWRTSVSGGPPVGVSSPHLTFEAGKEAVPVGGPFDRGPRLIWGGAADSQRVYFGVSTGGVAALRLDTGAREWFTPLPREGGGEGDTCAPASATREAVFAAGGDGVVRALSTVDGRVLWKFATAREFDTVNDVPARGGRSTPPALRSPMEWCSCPRATRSSARSSATCCSPSRPNSQQPWRCFARTMPRLNAAATASPRDRASSFSRIAETWWSTVFRERCKVRASCGFVRPSASSMSTSISRDVSPAGLRAVVAFGPRGTSRAPSSRKRRRTMAASGAAPRRSSTVSASRSGSSVPRDSASARS